ncbi:MAG: hypothetical protein AB1733_12560 [Thermodesulfobacteriota bacterium]
MAKLKDQTSPQELMELILGGTMKSEIIKRFRTSDEELAIMLLPLYRSGDITKEEFNDFFKGTALTPRQPQQQEQEVSARGPSQEDLPPSEIVRSLAAEQQETAEEPPPAEAEPQQVAQAPVEYPTTQAVEAQPQRETLLSDVGELEMPPEDDSMESAPGDAPEPKEAPKHVFLIERILKRLDSIDRRLAAIEGKLGSN